jgi:transposase
MKGKRAAPTRRITEEIKRKCKQSNERGAEFVSVDEYLTSQICNKCKYKQLNNISVTGSKRRVHSVLKCKSCGTVWNRDVNSALNIYGIFVYKSKHDNESPPPLQKAFRRLAVLLDLMRCL